MVLYSPADLARASLTSMGLLIAAFFLMRLTLKDSFNIAGLTFLAAATSCAFVTHLNGSETEKLHRMVAKRTSEAAKEKEYADVRSTVGF